MFTALRERSPTPRPHEREDLESARVRVERARLEFEREVSALTHDLSAPLRQAKILAELLQSSYSDGLSQKGRSVLGVLNKVIEGAHRQMSSRLEIVRARADPLHGDEIPPPEP